MWYKRFGFKYPDSSYAGGMGCFSMIFVYVASLSMAFFIAVFLQNGWLFFTVIPISFSGFYLAEKYASNEGDRLRRKRLKHHLDLAQVHISSGSTPKALESLRKAKIYGELPTELQEFEHRNNE